MMSEPLVKVFWTISTYNCICSFRVNGCWAPADCFKWPNDFHCLMKWIGYSQGFLWMSYSVLGCELEISSPGVTLTLLQVVDYYSQELAEIEWNPCNPQLSKDSHDKHWPHSKNGGSLLSITHSSSFPTWQVHFIVEWSSIFTEGKLMDGLWDNFLYSFMTWNTWTILSEFAAEKTWWHLVI